MADTDHQVKRDLASWAADHLARDDPLGADLHLTFGAEDWRRCAERGIHGIRVPTELGGSGADLATALLTLEGLRQGCRDNGLAFAIGSQILSTQETIVRFGSPEQQERWIPPLIRGEAIGAFAMTETDAGSDAYAMSTRAERRDDGAYVLNGRKAYITLASRCDMVIVFASTKPDAGRWGLSAFLVPTDVDGVRREPDRDKMGMRTTPFGDITLTDAVVPASALIGRYQAVAHRLADMQQRHEAARLFLYRAAPAFVAGTGSSLWRVLKIVTMFTIAHSITLAVGGLGIVELSPRLVETIIALSIAAAALHNIRPIFANKEWVLAFAFGLFHGFGFAGLLSELGLDRSNRFLSLLGFNIGVELGQAAIILMVFPMLFILRRTRYYLGILYGGSVVLALVAPVWATERIFDYDTQVNELVDPILQWPRSAGLVAVGYVVATALWWFDRSRGRLAPVEDPEVVLDLDEPPERELVNA